MVKIVWFFFYLIQQERARTYKNNELVCLLSFIFFIIFLINWNLYIRTSVSSCQSIRINEYLIIQFNKRIRTDFLVIKSLLLFLFNWLLFFLLLVLLFYFIHSLYAFVLLFFNLFVLCFFFHKIHIDRSSLSFSR